MKRKYRRGKKISARQDTTSRLPLALTLSPRRGNTYRTVQEIW